METQRVKNAAIKAREVCEKTSKLPPEKKVEVVGEAVQVLRTATQDLLRRIEKDQKLVGNAQALERNIVEKHLEPAEAEVACKSGLQQKEELP